MRLGDRLDEHPTDLRTGADLDHADGPARPSNGIEQGDGAIAIHGDDVVRAVNHLREMSPLFEMHKQGIDLKTVQWAAH